MALGELGYDEQTPLEDKYLRAQIELAKEVELPIMIHTPHRDKNAVRCGPWTCWPSTPSSPTLRDRSQQ